ncbi:Lrp/AsnC family transcriptional regulator [Nocardiopsis tropica]
MRNNSVMDSLDRAILDELVRDGRLTNQELAHRVGLTPAPCLRRVRRLEADGVITGYTAVLDPAALGKGFEVLINADLSANDRASVEAFESRVAAMEEVIEVRRMFGLPDYLIRVRVADAEAFEKWLTTHLMGDPAIVRVDSRMTMKVVK